MVKLMHCTYWENVLYYITKTGFISSITLKTMLFKKNFKLSAATNKEYTSGKIISLIDKDAEIVWTIIQDLPDLVEIPCVLLLAGYTVYMQVGLNVIVAGVLFALTSVLAKIRAKGNFVYHK